MVIQSSIQVILEVNRFFLSSSCQEVDLHAIPPSAKLQDSYSLGSLLLKRKQDQLMVALLW